MDTRTESTTRVEVEVTRELLRTFHLTGNGLDDLLPLEDLKPAGLEDLKALPRLGASWPMFIEKGRAARPFPDLLCDIVTTEHPPLPAARECLAQIAAAFATASTEAGLTPASSLIPVAIATLAGQTPLLPLGGDQLDRDMRRLCTHIPPEGFLVPFTSDAVLALYAADLFESRAPARARYRESLKQSRDRLRELLALDDSLSPDSMSPDRLAASLGSGAGIHFNVSALSAALQRPTRASRQMAADRRSRCQQAIDVLDDAWRQSLKEPAYWVFAATPRDQLFEGRAVAAADPCASALQFICDQLKDAVPVFRALRIAKLELTDCFDPDIHLPALERFGWETAENDELLALPPVLVDAAPDSLSGSAMPSFARLLRSGKPVQILTTCLPLSPEDLRETAANLGALGIAHSQAFVLQSSLAEPAHLLPGLARMTRSLRPALAVVASPDEDQRAERAFTKCALLHLTRTFPLFTYDPDRGDSLADRVTLHSDDLATLSSAHAAAFEASLSQCFRVIPESAWDSDQVELSDYLKSYACGTKHAIPYLSVLDEQGAPQRAILTRTLVDLCRDRKRAWHLIEQLATPAAKSSAAATGPSDAKQLASLCDAAKREGAAQAIQKVLSMLQTAN